MNSKEGILKRTAGLLVTAAGYLARSVSRNTPAFRCLLRDAGRRAMLPALILLCLFGLTISAQAFNVNVNQDTFVLSNEAPGYLITKLINAGYGDDNLYQALVDIARDTNPSVSSLLTPAFMLNLKNAPAGSQIFTTLLKDVSSNGVSVSISSDGTARYDDVEGGPFYGTFPTLVSNISGVGFANFTHSTDSATPLNATVVDGPLEGMTTTYNAFAVAFSAISPGEYCGGTGTTGNPYQICSTEALLAMASDTNDYDANFVLTADIDLRGYSFTTAVIAPDTNKYQSAFVGTVFTGDFNGNGHTISNLAINANADMTKYIGLFGRSDGRIRNLRLKKVNITTGYSCSIFGGLVGYNGGDINNCSSTGVVTGGYFAAIFGGLVGFNVGNISWSFSSAAVKGGFGTAVIGGLAGYNYNADINYCYSTGAVSGGYAACNLGGLVGEYRRGDMSTGNNRKGSINNCFSTSDVTGGDKSSYLGGLTGLNNFGFTNNCYSTGNITGKDCVGGLMGSIYDTNIVNCYSKGTVICDANRGGLVGFSSHNNSSIDYSYFLITSGFDNGVGEPLQDKQLKQRASFVGWDFVNVWKIDEGIGYPLLIWEPNQIWVKKCTVAAGVKVSTDKISFAGQMGATLDDFNRAAVITATLDSEDMDSSYVKIFDVNSTTFKKGKFKGAIINKPSKIILTFDTKKKVVSFSASNVSLTGLSCPLTFGIKVGGYNGEAWLNEKIVNGPKKPIPIKLLMGVTNSLRVDKSKFARDKTTTNITQLAVSGGFSVEDLNDANMVTNPLDITIGSQTFTIPAHNFKNAKGKFTCSKVDTSKGIAAAIFDFNKCTFTLTIKGTDFAADSGTVDFNMNFASFSGSDVVTLP